MELVNGLTSKKKECLSDKIHDKILEMIIKNPPGEEQVLTEGKLVELFGVSKAPVREALIKLCSEGIVRSVPRYGYVVLHMTEKEAEEVIGLRRLLEKEALKSSFFKLTEENLSSLKDQIDKTVSQNDISLWDVWDDNAEFHLMLASFSQNYILINFCGNVWIWKREYMPSVFGIPEAAWMRRQTEFPIWESIRSFWRKIWMVQ